MSSTAAITDNVAQAIKMADVVRLIGCKELIDASAAVLGIPIIKGNSVIDTESVVARMAAEIIVAGKQDKVPRKI